MNYLSQDIDLKILELKGEYDYSLLYSKLKDNILFGIEKDDALNFLRQSIYRLNKLGKIQTIKRGLFAINMDYDLPKKIKLSHLIEIKEAARDIDELALAYKITEQIPFKRVIWINNKYRSLVENDIDCKIKYSNNEINSYNIKFFEFAKLSLFFDLTTGSGLNQFARILISENLFDSNSILNMTKYVHPKYRGILEKFAASIGQEAN